MSTHDHIITSLFHEFEDIRYVALYVDNDLVFRQKDQSPDSSSNETDRYEELLVNPTLLKLASQRANIDCGGLDQLIIGYTNFHQLVKQIRGGHISICLRLESDLNQLPGQIFNFLGKKEPVLFNEK